jgi:hypothetical protein
MDMKKMMFLALAVVMLVGCFFLVQAIAGICDDFQQKGIIEVDRATRTIYFDPGVWSSLPYKSKQQFGQAVRSELGTSEGGWTIADMNSGKKIGRVHRDGSVTVE